MKWRGLMGAAVFALGACGGGASNANATAGLCAKIPIDQVRTAIGSGAKVTSHGDQVCTWQAGDKQVHVEAVDFADSGYFSRSGFDDSHHKSGFRPVQAVGEAFFSDSVSKLEAVKGDQYMVLSITLSGSSQDHDPSHPKDAEFTAVEPLAETLYGEL